MKRQFSKIATFFGILTGSIALMLSCSGNEPTLGKIPTPSFSFKETTPISDSLPQNILLVNTTSPKGIAYWTIKGVGTFKGDTVKATTVFKGTYEVDLVVASQGGITDTLKQNIVINNDNPLAISPKSLLNVMTNAIGSGVKVWYAPRILYTCVVGQDIATNLAAIAAGSGAWWGFGPGEIDPVTGRNGYLDDTYTFYFGNDFKYVYDDKGTVFLDGGGSGWTKALAGSTVSASAGSSPVGTPYKNAVGNYPTSEVYGANPALVKWGPGTFSYSVTPPPAGAMGLGQITVNGVGAHLAMQDKTPGGDLLTPSVSSVTYDILKEDLNVTSGGKTYDQIIIGFGIWAFVLRSDH